MKEKNYDFEDLVQGSGLTERNVRYYLHELIQQSERIPGTQRYPKSVWNKIVFIGKLREEADKYHVRLSWDGIKEIFRDAPDSIEAVADGRESLEIFLPNTSEPEKTRNKINNVVARGEVVLNVNTNHLENEKPSRSAKDYIQQHASSFSSPTTTGSSKQKVETRKKWQRVQLGENVELRVRGKYSKKTLDQLALLGQFVDSILQKEENND